MMKKVRCALREADLYEDTDAEVLNNDDGILEKACEKQK